MHHDQHDFIQYYMRWMHLNDRSIVDALLTKGDCARALNHEIECAKEEHPSRKDDLDKLTINLEQTQNVPWRVFASRMKYLLENY